jgi:hypothetical protein
MASDAKRMITETILFIFHFHLVIASDGGFWVESGRFAPIVAREATNLYDECSPDRPAPPILFRICYRCRCVCRESIPDWAFFAVKTRDVPDT